MAKMAMFFRQMMATFLLCTRPDSSMAKPAAIHMTRTPLIRKEKVLRIKVTSLTGASSARARAGVRSTAMMASFHILNIV